MSYLRKTISWETIFKLWEETLTSEQVVFPPHFRTIRMFDSGKPSGRKPFLAPWPRAEAFLEQVRHQRNFLNYNGYFEEFAKSIFRNLGTQDFFYDLTDAVDDWVKMAGLIMVAALWQETSRQRQLINISGEAYRKVYWATIKGLGWDDAPWSIKYSSLIPLGYLSPLEGTIDTPEMLVKSVASAFARFLQEFELVLVKFDTEPDPEVLAIIEKQEQQRADTFHQYQDTREKDKMRQVQERAAFKLAHPMSDDWAKLTAQDLHRLIWEHPVTYLAKQFGLSDAAIHKKCKKMGVAKPGAGYWAKVHSKEK